MSDSKDGIRTSSDALRMPLGEGDTASHFSF